MVVLAKAPASAPAHNDTSGLGGLSEAAAMLGRAYYHQHAERLNLPPNNFIHLPQHSQSTSHRAPQLRVSTKGVYISLLPWLYKAKVQHPI